MKLCSKILLMLLFITVIEMNEFIAVILQKCYGSCNKKFCNFSATCRPLNRTAKLSSMNIYFHPGVVLQAPIYLDIIANKKFRTVYRQHMVKLRLELCEQLALRNHPIFTIVAGIDDGNVLDPCPLRGHRYVKPQVSTYRKTPLVPVGEWRLDFLITKNINNSDVRILSWFDFYEVKPTSATEF